MDGSVDAGPAAAWGADRPPFVVFALPRSRTKWLSEFLAPWPRRCGHDIAIQCATPEEFLTRLADLGGTVETGAMYGWRALRSRLPEAKLVVLWRSPEEVRESFLRLDIDYPLAELQEKAIMLRELSRQPRVLTIGYAELSDWRVATGLFETLLGEPCPLPWFNGLTATNIQIDMDERIAYLKANWTRIQTFKEAVLAEVVALEPS